MAEDGREREARRITSDFTERDPEEWARYAKDLEGIPASVEITVENFSPDLSDFVKNQPEHAVIIRGTQPDVDGLKKTFPEIAELFKYEIVE